jgi:hypothetical protein
LIDPNRLATQQNPAAPERESGADPEAEITMSLMAW